MTRKYKPFIPDGDIRKLKVGPGLEPLPYDPERFERERESKVKRLVERFFGTKPVEGQEGLLDQKETGTSDEVNDR